jgi:uncharacterized Tic20 family protein
MMLSGRVEACKLDQRANAQAHTNFRMSLHLSSDFPSRNGQNGLHCQAEILHNAPMDTPPPPPPQDAPPTSPPSPGIDATERQWALGLHFSALLGFAGPHLLNVIGPLIIWLIKKQDSPYLDAVGKRVLNFQLSYSLYGFAAITLFGLLWWLVIGFIFLPIYAIVGVAWLVLTIIGAVKESNGETYEYPYVIKFLQ